MWTHRILKKYIQNCEKRRRKRKRKIENKGWSSEEHTLGRVVHGWTRHMDTIRGMIALDKRLLLCVRVRRRVELGSNKARRVHRVLRALVVAVVAERMRGRVIGISKCLCVDEAPGVGMRLPMRLVRRERRKRRAWMPHWGALRIHRPPVCVCVLSL